MTIAVSLVSRRELLYTAPEVLAWAREHVHVLATTPLNRLAEDARAALGSEAGPAALTLARLWWKNREKFPTWREFIADAEGSEQASGERPARWRAARFAGRGMVLDLCCGAGADTIALSLTAQHVVAVDWNMARLRWARANVERYGTAVHSRFLCADVQCHLPAADAVLLDPDRRSSGRRAVSPRRASPPPEVWERIRARTTGVAVKSAPGIPYDEIPRDAVPEFVEDRGECREAVLWFGDLRLSARTATVLSGGHDDEPLRGESITAGEPETHAVGEVGTVIYDPGPATVRAHLITHLATRLGAWRVDERIAYLSGDRVILTALAAAFRVEEVWPFHLRRIKSALRERKIGALEIRTRRFPISPEELRRQFALSGERQATLIFTKIHDHPVAILCGRVVE